MQVQGRVLKISFFLLSLMALLGSTFYEKPFTDTISQSALMVRGKIGSSTAQKSEGSDGSPRVYTLTDFTITEVLKGELPVTQIKVRQVGGEVDGVSLVISGSAHFDEGEDLVLTLAPSNQGETVYDLQGMMTGKFTVQKKPDGEEYLLGAGIPANEQGQWTLSALKETLKTGQPPAFLGHAQDSSGISSERPFQNQKLAPQNTKDLSHSQAQSQAPLQAQTPKSETLTSLPGPTPSFGTQRTLPQEDSHGAWIWGILLVIIVGAGTIFIQKPR